MAISRQQPMRPALNAALDALDTLEPVPQDVASLTQSLSATNQQVLLLTGEVNEIEQETIPDLSGRISTLEADTIPTLSARVQVLEQSTIPQLSERISTLEDEADYYIRGLSEKITIPASDSISTSIVFQTPFSANAACGVFPCVVTNELSTLFDITIIDCTYSGFSFQVTNSDADAHDVYIGYVAVSFGEIVEE